MSNTINSMSTATQNSTTLVSKNQSLAEDCVVVVGDEPTGPSFKSRHEGQILFNNQPVNNENVSSGEIRWLGKEFIFRGKKTSTGFQQAIATRLKRLRREFGININGMCVVPKASLDAFYLGVNNAKVEFFEKRDELLLQLPQLIKAHKDANPTLADLIDEKSLDVKQLTGKYAFKESIPLAVTLHRPEDESKLQQSAVDALYGELATEWNDNYKKSFAGKDKVKQRALTYFKGTMDKLLRLAWLDESIYLIIDKINTLTNKMPKHGWIEKGDFQELAHFALMLSNKDAITAIVANSKNDLEDDLVVTDAIADVISDSADNDSNDVQVLVIDDDGTIDAEAEAEVEVVVETEIEVTPTAKAKTQVKAQVIADVDDVFVDDSIKQPMPEQSVKVAKVVEEQVIVQDAPAVELIQQDVMESAVQILSDNLLLIEDGSDEDEELTF